MENKKDPMILLIDCMAICHAAKHSVGNIGLTSENMGMGIILGFLNRISYLADKFQTDKFVFCWDPKINFRKKAYPLYKANRIKTDITPEEEAFDFDAIKQFTELRSKTLFELGFVNVFMANGYEADDLIANISQKYIDDDFIIATVDSDLYQLLSPTTRVYNLRTKKIITTASFTKEYDITPDEWIYVKALMGDSSDNIKGIEGIGQTRATQYVKNTMKPTSKFYPMLKSTESKEIINTNLGLIRLPYPGTPLPRLREYETLYSKDFHDVFTKYDFKSLLRSDTFPQWIRRFNLQ